MDYPDYAPGRPAFQVGRFGLGGGGEEWVFDQKAFSFHESMSWIKGPHTMKYTGEDVALDGLGEFLAGAWHPVALRKPAKEHASKDSKVTEWFDTTALVLPQVGTYGNAARGLTAGPGWFMFDLGVLKDFPVGISEDSRLQFRAEFFNLLNHTNLGDPLTDMSYGPPWFGLIVDAAPRREIQFGLKLLW